MSHKVSKGAQQAHPSSSTDDTDTASTSSLAELNNRVNSTRALRELMDYLTVHWYVLGSTQLRICVLKFVSDLSCPI